MKCPTCSTPMIEITVYGETYLMCKEERLYFTTEKEEIEDIVEYKNKIRRKALKEYFKITEIDDEDKE